MDQLSFAVSAAGLVVPVWVGPDALTLADQAMTGKPIESPLPGLGLLDTGTDITAVAGTILKRLGLPPGPR